MKVTVSDFNKATGISRHTVYSWIYRDKMPEGLSVAGIGKTKILHVSRKSEYYDLIEKQVLNH